MKLLPKGLLKDLALQTKVDHQVKKLSGEVIFKLILFSMLNGSKLSLRVMEGFLQSAQFRSFSGDPALQSKYNSIRDRICTLEASYFEKLLEKITAVYLPILGAQHSFAKADSTYVALATKLLPNGIENGVDKSKRFVKFSILLKGSLPVSAKAFSDQGHANEDVALFDLLDNADQLKEDIVVFDRGLQSRKSFDAFTDSDKFFITRAKINTRCKGANLTVTADEEGHLMTKREKISRHTYRLIRTTLHDSGEEICFLTNIKDEDAYRIAQWYRERWQIELFFKFLKQHLNFSHLVSRTDNGIKVMLYMTLILATLIQVYKTKNSIGSFKLAKLRFEIDLENDIIQSIVKLCDGNPRKAPYLWNTS
ncbi:IS4 family transposase [Flavisolibacter sp. BT320]|nr:IS4 family transposase [Flavisolibacter longurius]